MPEELPEVEFPSIERRLKTYLRALWGMGPVVRVASRQADIRRIAFDGGMIRMPDTFPGFHGEAATALFRAALAHVGAHLRHSGERFPVGQLKPLQIALVSLIEDARVEQLAMREYPGLRKLWGRFHVASPGGAGTAPALMARLARALFDPDWTDDDPWVAKGRRLFFEAEADWEDAALSRRIGGLLGNDLGQMRVQFNAKTYTVEPAYRDDNLGLWDFDDMDDPDEAADQIFISAKVDRQETSDGTPDQPDDGAGNSSVGRARNSAVELRDPPPMEGKGAVKAYPEWDYLISAERPDWAKVGEYQAPAGDISLLARDMEGQSAAAGRLKALVRGVKVGRPVRLRRRPEGDQIDLDAAIDAMLARRMGDDPDANVYSNRAALHRDLSVLMFVDVSESTNDLTSDGKARILDLARVSTLLMAEAMADLGDPFALHAFCSDGRKDVRYFRLKDFGEPYGAAAKAKLAGLKGGLSTRLGPALRHAGSAMAACRTHRRLLLVLTDGEPSDVDIADRRYLVEDARRAVQSLAAKGIDTFCVALDPQGDSYLARIFGDRGYLVVDRAERLPEKLPQLYFKLTS